jgi:hypothetical protein
MTTTKPSPQTALEPANANILSSDLPAFLIGKKVCRGPFGRICEVTGISINTETGVWRVRIKDSPTWHGWVTGDAFGRKWVILG